MDIQEVFDALWRDPEFLEMVAKDANEVAAIIRKSECAE